MVFYVAGQTVVHEDEDEEIANSLTSQMPGVTDPVPAPELGQVLPSVLVSAAVEDSADNADQGTNPLPADNSATQDNGAVSAENAVEAAAAAVEDVAAATYSAHAIGNLIAAAELESPIREGMSVDGDNSTPATPSAAIDPMNATISLPEVFLPHAAEDDGAANSTDNQTTNSDEQMQS